MDLLYLIPIAFWGLVIVWVIRLNLRPKSEPPKVVGECSVFGKHFTNKEGFIIEYVPYCSEKCFKKTEMEDLNEELMEREKRYEGYFD